MITYISQEMHDQLFETGGTESITHTGLFATDSDLIDRCATHEIGCCWPLPQGAESRWTRLTVCPAHLVFRCMSFASGTKISS